MSGRPRASGFTAPREIFISWCADCGDAIAVATGPRATICPSCRYPDGRRIAIAHYLAAPKQEAKP